MILCNSCIFARTGVPDCPRIYKKLYCKFVEYYKFVHMILCNSCIFARTVEDACPYTNESFVLRTDGMIGIQYKIMRTRLVFF